MPGKNVRDLGGKPLISWSIEVASRIEAICDVLVSTDEEEIAEVARKDGALVPWLRPPELATDSAGSVEVAIHALDHYEREFGRVDGLLLLQPTSPFRSLQQIEKAISLYDVNRDCPVIAVSPSRHHPDWSFTIEQGFLVPLRGRSKLDTRSQDLLPAYTVNGNLYLISPESLRNGQSFISDHAIPLIIESRIEEVDIDTEADFDFAETIVSAIRHD